MPIGTPVMGTRFYALDDDAFEDGSAGAAHYLRAMSMSANRLLCQGEPVMTLVWDASVGADESSGNGMLKGYGNPFWTQVCAGPIIVPKKPGLRRMELNATALIVGTNTIELAMTTSLDHGRLNSAAVLEGAVTMTGDGSNDYQHFAVTGIPCSPDEYEQLAFFIRGRVTTTAPAAGTGSGQLESADASGLLTDTGAAFDASLPRSHAIVLRDSSGNPITTPRVIVSRDSATTLRVWPSIEGSLLAAATTAYYVIYQLPVWRLACLNVNTEDRTA